MTTWIKCSDQMPPDDMGQVIVSYRFGCDKDLFATTGQIINNYFDDFVVQCIEWTPYNPELWEELNNEE